MLSRTAALIGGLGIAVVGLAIGLAVSLASDGDSNDNHMLMGQPGYAGMMGAMGAMDSQAMLQHMKEVLGDDGFNQVQLHLQDHRSGAAVTGNTQMDQMMHSMMDGMMGQMGLVPPTDRHHETPTPSSR